MTARKRASIKKAFTLLELIVSLGLFAIIMALLMQYFSSAQKVWLSASGKSEMFENARVAFNLIENDLLSAYYQPGHNITKLFFYPADATQFGFAVQRQAPPFKGGSSGLCEVQYKYDAANARLLMNIVGDYTYEGTSNSSENGGKWDLLFFTTAMSSTNNPFVTYDDSVYDPKDGSNPNGWSEIIPYVVNFTYTLRTKNGTEITARGADFISQGNKLPYSVTLSLTLSDRDSIAKYLAKGGSLSALPTTTDRIIVDSKRTFTRQIIIERGQYN